MPQYHEGQTVVYRPVGEGPNSRTPESKGTISGVLTQDGLQAGRHVVASEEAPRYEKLSTFEVTISFITIGKSAPIFFKDHFSKKSFIVALSSWENVKRLLRSSEPRRVAVAAGPRPLSSRTSSSATTRHSFSWRRHSTAANSSCSSLEIINPEMVSGYRSRVTTVRSEAVDGDGHLKWAGPGQPDTPSRGSSVTSYPPSISEPTTMLPMLPYERILASGNGIVVALGLTEPVLYLEGVDQRETQTKSSMLRGALHLRITKPTKIKKIRLHFKGQAVTTWPEGVLDKKTRAQDKETITSYTWPFFNAQDNSAEYTYGADHIQFFKSKKAARNAPLHPINVPTAAINLPGHSTSNTSSNSTRRHSLQNSHSSNFQRSDSGYSSTGVAQRGYKIFPPGDYMFDFELQIQHKLPETVDCENISVKYDLTATIERAGTFRPKLVGSKEIPFIRTPFEGSLEHVEPIAISRTWDDQLQYDIIISGKSFPLGGTVPIAFKLTPLAKVSLHRIKVYVTESVQIWAQDRNLHQVAGRKQLLLFEKRADAPAFSAFPGSSMRIMSGGGVDWEQRDAGRRGEEHVINQRRSNLLGDFDTDFGVGPTELEFEVQLPSCPVMKRRDDGQRLHCDSTQNNVEINHWVKIVLRLSRPDESNPGKRRHFEISIDSPFHIISCMAQPNIYVPSYTSPSFFYADQYECGCSGATPVPQDASICQETLPLASPSANRPPPFYSENPASPASSSGSSPSTSSLEVFTHTHNTSHNSHNLDGSPTGLTLPEAAYLPQEGEQRPSHTRPRHQLQRGDHERSRPIHLLRLPSFAPPAFDAVPPPPPILTPPPDYSSHGFEERLESYFAEGHNSEGGYDGVCGNRQVHIPLTPGGRINRSMDLPRDFFTIERELSA
ncbi:hypothetical protein FQN57_003943 [Myotisia sp. PD_48]|nr:hypothetical protein FQN57_003943 [Myotisia sp. PD_48]